MSIALKHKLLNLSLILTTFLGYLEWGGGNSMFLLQGEIEIFRKLFTDPISVLHPFVLIPLLGQILLLLTLFQKQPGRLLTWIGMAGIGLLLGFMFVIGVIGVHITVALSAIPFLVAAVWTLHHLLATRQRPI